MLHMGLSFMTFIILSYIPSMGFPGGSVVKNPRASARDAGSIPGSGSSPGEGNGNPLQYSYLGDPMDRGTWWAIPTWGHKRVRHNLATKQQQHSLYTHFVESFYHKIISIVAEKAFDRIQHLFMVKNNSAKWVQREHTST